MNQKRPVNLSLTSLKFPPMAIISILHRISGVILFLLSPLLLYWLGLSLKSEVSFNYLSMLLQSPWHRFLFWVVGSAWLFHLIAGIRHMIMDLGFGEELHQGRASAVVAMGISFLLIIIFGVAIW